MYCPSCGTQNLGEDDEKVRFCRACGADLRAISRAMNRSLPVRMAAALDSYFENRFQQNFRNGVLNLLAFVFLLIVGTGYVISGWTGFGILMLVLALIAIVSGIWDIWIYRRNLPAIAERSLRSNGNAPQLSKDEHPQITPPSVTEQTTKHLHARPSTEE